MDKYEAYRTLQEACEFREGDKVLITHKVKAKYLGWENGWAPIMNRALGKVYTVAEQPFNNLGVLMKEDDKSYPWFCLVKVGEQYEYRRSICRNAKKLWTKER